MIRFGCLKPLVSGWLALVPAIALAQTPVVIGPNGLDPEMAKFMRTAEYAFAFQAAGLMLLVVAVVGMSLYFANLREKRKQELVIQYVEKGQEIPRALLPPAPSKMREVRRGIWLASLGLGLGLALYIATEEWRIAAWCLILLFLSAACFINAALFFRDDDPTGGRGDTFN